jgi:prepilin-type N-terminal cleavage/methylation domain-containing protein
MEKKALNIIYKSQKAKGFTLVELLLVVVIIVLFGGFSVPVYQSFQVKNSLINATNQIAQSFSRAQLLSQASEGDSSWGVSVQTSYIIVFKGVNFATREVAFDETFPLPQTIVPSGMTEVVFSKIFGLPQSSGTLTLTSSIGEVEEIILNSKGMIEY